MSTDISDNPVGTNYPCYEQSFSLTFAFKIPTSSTSAFQLNSEPQNLRPGLKLRIGVQLLQGKEKFSVHVLMDEDDVKALPSTIVDFSFTLLAQKSDHKSISTPLSRDRKTCMDIHKLGWGFNEFFQRSMVETIEAGYLDSNNYFKICLKGNVMNTSAVATVSPAFSSLLLSETFSDVRILAGVSGVAAAAAVLPAHKCILAARSDYFRALFTGSSRGSKHYRQSQSSAGKRSREGASYAVTAVSTAAPPAPPAPPLPPTPYYHTPSANHAASYNASAAVAAVGSSGVMEVRFNEFPAAVVRAALQFIYTNSMPADVLKSNPIQMLQLAMFLQCDELLQCSQKHLAARFLTAGNISGLLQFAQQHHLSELQTGIFKFIRESTAVDALVK